MQREHPQTMVALLTIALLKVYQKTEEKSTASRDGGKFMFEALEHPAITRSLRTGYPDVQRENICPCCGEACQKIYLRFSDVIGCDVCIDVLAASDYFEED